MGYTHYFTLIKTPTDKQWSTICKRVRECIKQAPEQTCTAGGYYVDEPLSITGAPSIDDWIITNNGVVHTIAMNDEIIRFNGSAALDHEDFILDRYRAGFDFCKTERKPYDLIVCAALIIAEQSGCWDVSSDGDESDWNPARNLVNSITPKRGRPKSHEEDRRSFGFYVDRVRVERLKKLGDGNQSAGLIKLIDKAVADGLL